MQGATEFRFALTTSSSSVGWPVLAGQKPRRCISPSTTSWRELLRRRSINSARVVTGLDSVALIARPPGEASAKDASTAGLSSKSL